MTIKEFKKSDFEYEILEDGDIIFWYYDGKKDVDPTTVGKEGLIQWAKENIEGFDYRHAEDSNTEEIYDEMLTPISGIEGEYEKFQMLREISNL